MNNDYIHVIFLFIHRHVDYLVYLIRIRTQGVGTEEAEKGCQKVQHQKATEYSIFFYPKKRNEPTTNVNKSHEIERFDYAEI